MQRTRRTRLPVDPEAFGRLLRQVRLERGLSQEALAFAMIPLWKRRHAGTISSTWVAQAERGLVKSVDRDRIACAAEALGVSVIRLLPQTDEPPATETDVALTLRRYGLSDADVERFLVAIQDAVRQTARPDE